jgi:hypothetical protein
MIVHPTGNLDIKCFVDADFAGLYKCEPDRNPDSARSRTGYVIMLGGCPLVWKSQLQTEIAMSTLEAEYSALSYAMRALIPIRELVIEISGTMKLAAAPDATISCTVFEDNNGALLLATKQRITSRTKYYNVKWHFFWSHVHPKGPIAIAKIETVDQLADYFTKGLPREAFERNRKGVQGW